MFKKLKKSFYSAGAAFTVGTMASTPAFAQNDFSSIAQNITASIQNIPGLITGLSYLAGTMFGVLGILKIKDHVENPTQTQLKDGAIRLAAGGGLFALPIIYEAMTNTVGQTGVTTQAATLNAVGFNVTP